MLNISENRDLISSLIRGEFAVIPTDTIYGIVTTALNTKSVERLYKIKNRAPEKPYIILISSLDDLARFEIFPSDQEIKLISENWPGPVSIILACDNDEFAYLHRGKRSLAFRMPANEPLREPIAKTGPLVAPSANPENQPPATTIEEARSYFEENVSVYISGRVSSRASEIIAIENNKVTVLRP